MKPNWFDWSKSENEKLYTEYCEHKDLIFSVGEVQCRSCGIKQPWDGSSYSVQLPKVKWQKNGEKRVSD